MSVKKVSEGFVTGQVACTNSATLIAAANPGRDVIILVNTSAVACFIGGSGVAVGTGLLLAGVVGSTLVIPATAAIYGISGTSATVSYLDAS